MLCSIEGSPYLDLIRSILNVGFSGRLKRSEWVVQNAVRTDARKMVAAFHYAGGGSTTGVYFHGLFRRDSNQLMGVVWWLPPTRRACESVNRTHWKQVLSLSRMVLHPDCPKNAASFLLSRSVRMIKREGRFVSLVTYADESQGHKGDVYKAANWQYVGRTNKTPRWVNRDGRQVSALSTKTRRKAEMEAMGYQLEGYFHKHKFVLHLDVRARA